MEGPPQENVFKANKRRKIIRKRKADEYEDEVRPTDAPATERTGEDAGETPSVVRRPVIKKQGVTFSTFGPQSVPPSAVGDDTALVPFSSENAQVAQISQHDRFTKPTGRAEVVEDKHLTAYVDSKLAELRSSTATPTQNASMPTAALTALPVDSTLQPIHGETEHTEKISATDGFLGRKQVYPYGSRNRNPRPRRQPQSRDEGSLARDAMIDQILQESEIPLYDRASSAAKASSQDGIDADEAAAEAFKQQFLASLEEQNRRKPPAPPPNSRTAPAAPVGPKLGGSRSQREKMRAIEEAKNGTKK